MKTELKTFEQCKREVARKQGFGKLVTGHLVKYFDEAAEIYASQFRPSSEAIKAAMEKAFNAGQIRGAEEHGTTAGWLGCKLQSKTFDKWYDENRDRIAGELSGSGWISVEERLPEVGEFVLVHNTEGATLTGRLYENGWAALFIDGEKLAGELAVTHWQPLPSPPTK